MYVELGDPISTRSRDAAVEALPIGPSPPIPQWGFGAEFCHQSLCGVDFFSVAPWTTRGEEK
jgi:hypothetical protein